jgi:hypothetical protein
MTRWCRYSKIDAREGRVVELRYFGGLSVEETAEVLQVSPEMSWVTRKWQGRSRAIFDSFRYRALNVEIISSLLSHGAPCGLPYDPQIQHGDAAKERHEQKGDESGNSQSADLRGTART